MSFRISRLLATPPTRSIGLVQPDRLFSVVSISLQAITGITGGRDLLRLQGVGDPLDRRFAPCRLRGHLRRALSGEQAIDGFPGFARQRLGTLDLGREP